MCLVNISEKKVAEKDITCYKYLHYELKESDIINVANNGDPFECFIYKIKTKGHITIQGNKVYLCTDDPNLDGKDCDDKHGHEFSWIFGGDVQVCTINDNKINNTNLLTLYRNAIVVIGEIYKSKLVLRDDRVNEGLHSYTNIPEKNGNIIVRCTIPQGSEYYEGDFNGEDSLASDTLRYDEIIFNPYKE